MSRTMNADNSETEADDVEVGELEEGDVYCPDYDEKVTAECYSIVVDGDDAAILDEEVGSEKTVIRTFSFDDGEVINGTADGMMVLATLRCHLSGTPQASIDCRGLEIQMTDDSVELFFTNYFTDERQIARFEA